MIEDSRYGRAETVRQTGWRARDAAALLDEASGRRSHVHTGQSVFTFDVNG
jgi:hypothetical protein